MTRDELRQAAQLAFVASGQEVACGAVDELPLPLAQLLALDASHPDVVEAHTGGLTGFVFRLRNDRGDWNIKRARSQSLVQNPDGQTSFLNEVQRRCELEALGDSCPAGVVRTRYASFRSGLIVSDWIPGTVAKTWNERTLGSLFDLLIDLYLHGFFEWDVSPGNLVDDGDRLWMFDFGYMYRFDPLVDLNSNGLAAPLFHPAERFETRNFFAVLLELERASGQDEALRAFMLEKRIALDAYDRLLTTLRARGASQDVLDWLSAIVLRWRNAMASDPAALYLAEGWRSHRLDLDDDLRGQTCTRRTLARTDWLIEAAGKHFDALTQLDALFWHDAGMSKAALLDQLATDRANAERWQVAGQ
ncbi:hypothetical protein GCM10025771_29710 [Niveibacterium umoris]|uniref:Uncharacterized protein n=1 Tax=Niveibacterium umoris TaxID=1193620 RepID=A0A840BLS6_9RHOO|nr:hypothetical protein [Niveibacterium umoris]MBB4011836.1 hypothetical protein [Niveibacterium umoris]